MPAAKLGDDPSANAAITAAPCQGPSAKAATIKAACNSPQGQASQSIPAIRAGRERLGLTGTVATPPPINATAGNPTSSGVRGDQIRCIHAGHRARHKRNTPSASSPRCMASQTGRKAPETVSHRSKPPTLAATAAPPAA